MATHVQDRLLGTLDRELSRYAKEGRLCVTVTGSGGKTTTIGRLARWWADQGYSVLVTTSTRMTHPACHRYDVDQIVLFNGASGSALDPHPGRVMLAGVDAGAKIAALSAVVLQSCVPKFDRVLVEGDGARSLALKIHAERDPVVLEESNVVLAVMGLSALGAELDERAMYLSDRFRSLSGLDVPVIDEQVYRALLDHPEGVFKDSSSYPVVLLCTQRDMVDQERLESLLTAMTCSWRGRDYTLIVGSWHDLCVDCCKHIKGERGEPV